MPKTLSLISKKPAPLAGWREIGGKNRYFRSKWEFNFSAYLQWQKENGHILNWEHEPKTFWFLGIRRGVVSYKPDFRVDNVDGSHYWVEVKGYMDSKSATKIKRFNKYHPEEELRIIDARWFKKNNEKMKIIVKGWE